MYTLKASGVHEAETRTKIVLIDAVKLQHFAEVLIGDNEGKGKIDSPEG